MTKRSIDFVVPLLQVHKSELRFGDDLELTAYILCHAVEGVMGGAARTRPDLLSSRVFRDQVIELTMGYLVGARLADR